MASSAETVRPIFDTFHSLEGKWADQIDHTSPAVMALVSAHTGTEALLIPTLRELVSDFQDQAKPLKLVVGLNDGFHFPALSGWLAARGGGVTRARWTGTNYRLEPLKPPTTGIAAVVMEQPKRTKPTGKLGMLAEAASLLKGQGADLWGGLPPVTLMFDAESRFKPSATALVARYKQGQPEVIGARYLNQVYRVQTDQANEAEPKPRIPISLNHEYSNKVHMYAGYLGGGGYLGPTAVIGPALETMGRELPNTRAEDAAMMMFAGEAGVPVEISREVAVTNRTSAIWETRQWQEQLKRWCVSSRSVYDFFEKQPTRAPKQLQLAMLTLATAAMFTKAWGMNDGGRSLREAQECLKGFVAFRASLARLPKENLTDSEIAPVW